jgi:hypothetical protein
MCRESVLFFYLLSFRYVIQQCKVQCLRQTLNILPAHRRADLPLATSFQRITPTNTASSYQQSQTGKRGDLSVDVDRAAEVVRQYGVQDRKKTVQWEWSWREEMARQFAVLTRLSSARASSSATFLSPLALAGLHEVYLIQSCRI